MKKLLVAPLAVCSMTTGLWAADMSTGTPNEDIGTQAVPTGYVRIYRDGNFEVTGSTDDYFNIRRNSGANYCYESMPWQDFGGLKRINWNDRVSSIVLYTNHAVTFYEHANYNRDQPGWSATLYPQYNAAKGWLLGGSFLAATPARGLRHGKRYDLVVQIRALGRCMLKPLTGKSKGACHDAT